MHKLLLTVIETLKTGWSTLTADTDGHQDQNEQLSWA